MKNFLVVFTLALLSLSFSAYTQESDQEVPDQIVAKTETGKIVFFRTGRGGGAVQFHVHNMAGEPMGYLGKSGDSFFIDIEPGTHQFWSRAASRNDVVIVVEAGKTSYVQATVKMGLAVGRPVLKEVDESKVPESARQK